MTKEFSYFVYFLIFLNNNFIIQGNITKNTGANSQSTTVNYINDTTPSDEDVKISGGYRHDHWGKYTASIRNLEKDSQSFGTGHFCGGCIISNNLILTASHCLFKIAQDKKRTPENSFGLRVVVGTIYRLQKLKSAQILNIKSLILHPYYDPVTYHNDIALIIVSDDIKEDGKYIAIIPLPSAPSAENLNCVAAGWGSVYYNGPKPDEILYATLVTLNENVCKAQHPTMGDNEICAYLPNDKDVDTCQGDSGGPLYCEGAVYGVVSRGLPCGLHAHTSGLYSSVYEHLSWINEKRSKAISKNCFLWTSFIPFFIQYIVKV